LEAVVERQLPEHLVGRDVVEAEGFPGGFVEFVEIGAGRLEQGVGPHNIGLDEFAGTVDRAVDMAFGGEIHHDVGPVFAKDIEHGAAIADVLAHEGIAGLPADRRKRGQIAGIGEFVDDDDRFSQFACDQTAHRRTDETGAACHHDLRHVAGSCFTAAKTKPGS
jgi:hypothetical protein